MSIILNNLRQLRKKTPLLFTIIIVVQVLVSFSILYVIGSIANDYFSLKEDRASTLFLDIHFETENENETVTLSELEPSLSELSDGVLSGSIDNIGIGSVRQPGPLRNHRIRRIDPVRPDDLCRQLPVEGSVRP